MTSRQRDFRDVVHDEFDQPQPLGNGEVSNRAE